MCVCVSVRCGDNFVCGRLPVYELRLSVMYDITSDTEHKYKFTYSDESFYKLWYKLSIYANIDNESVDCHGKSRTLFGCYLQFKFHNKASVLGPMLFILYIQYMKSASTYFYIFTFFYCLFIC